MCQGTSFKAVYAFSRVMTITFLISFAGTAYFSVLNSKWLCLLAVLSLVSWYRSKQRGFYHAREILNMYLANTRREECPSRQGWFSSCDGAVVLIKYGHP